jgi:hypothetical protein
MSFFVQLCKGTFWNWVLKQSARFGGIQTVRRLDPNGTQATIYAGRTDFQEQFFCPFGKLDFFKGIWAALFLTTHAYFSGSSCCSSDRLFRLWGNNISLDAIRNKHTGSSYAIIKMH